MSQKKDQIEQIVYAALNDGCAVSEENIKQMRDKAEKGISNLKWVFWVAIGLFNLMVWLPLFYPIAEGVRWPVAFGALATAIIFPILGIRRHRRVLMQLQDCTLPPKRKNTDDSGRKYMEQVKKQGRYFVRAEYSVLEGKPHPEN